MSREYGCESNSSIRTSKLRVRLLDFVKGEYFAYLDGDDFYCDDLKFQRQIDILDNPLNSDCICCANNTYFYYDDKSVVKIVPDYVENGRIPMKSYWYSLWFHASNCVFRSTIINTLPHELLDKIFHDNMITFWALQHGNMFYQDAVTMCYRQKVKSSIWTKSTEIIRHVRQVIVADVCNQINPKLWFCTYYRNRMSFEYLYNHRGENAEEFSEYICLAKELNCKQALQLICFNEQGVASKVFIRIKHILLCKICYLIAIRMNSTKRKA